MHNKQWSAQDLALGMDQPISRRDVLHGMALTAGSALAGGLLGAGAMAAEPGAPGSTGTPDTKPVNADYYPPTWQGLRGSAQGTFESAHALRDGRRWTTVADTGEDYDLVVVGAGLSGLAAAYFYRERMPAARILLLDNHDDFGGHARRNEYHLEGKLHLMNGGTLMVDSPRPYSAVAEGLLLALGIDVPALIKKGDLPKLFDEDGPRHAVFLDRETFGKDTLVRGQKGKSWVHFLKDTPLSERARRDLLRVEEGSTDYYPGKHSAEKKLLLSKISYEAYLRDVVRVDPQVIAVYQSLTKGEWGVGIDAVSALDCWGIGAPGFQGLKLDEGSIGRMGPTPAGYADTGGSPKLHFPDGNATIARRLVQSLIPAVAPAGSVDDLVTARFDYGQLDKAGAPVRLRLRSTVVNVRNRAAADGVPEGVDVSYASEGKAQRVRARHCVLACYNMIIPYLCPELPETQKAALHELVKTPLVYTSVAIRNATAFEKMGVQRVSAPGCYHTSFFLNPPMRIGSYQSPRSAAEPTLVFMQRTPCKHGLPEKEQNRAGRAELLSTSFETFERNIREQLGRILGPFGFDPAKDILGITVNRWPHGYAPEYNPLFEPELPEAQRPYVLGRAQFGQITIANSDAGGAAYTDSAFDQAHRAVGELLGSKQT